MIVKSTMLEMLTFRPQRRKVISSWFWPSHCRLMSNLVQFLAMSVSIHIASKPPESGF